MPLLNDIHSIVFPAASATSATFTAYTFTEIYAGAAATPTINGISVTMAPVNYRFRAYPAPLAWISSHNPQ
jgi:hypothetical protein